MAEFAEFRRATAERKAHAVEVVEEVAAVTERKVVAKTKKDMSDEDELAALLGSVHGKSSRGEEVGGQGLGFVSTYHEESPKI